MGDLFINAIIPVYVSSCCLHHRCLFLSGHDNFGANTISLSTSLVLIHKIVMSHLIQWTENVATGHDGPLRGFGHVRHMAQPAHLPKPPMCASRPTHWNSLSEVDRDANFSSKQDSAHRVIQGTIHLGLIKVLRERKTECCDASPMKRDVPYATSCAMWTRHRLHR